MVKPCHYLNLYFYVYLNVSCQTELCLLRSKGKKKKYWSTNKNSCCATLNVEQKEATAELYILDANASCLPPQGFLNYISQMPSAVCVISWLTEQPCSCPPLHPLLFPSEILMQIATPLLPCYLDGFLFFFSFRLSKIGEINS